MRVAIIPMKGGRLDEEFSAAFCSKKQKDPTYESAIMRNWEDGGAD